ncbi:hypothetical protein GCM10009828_009800 [Actinoplanes couchii]|uniref:Uncharacterized protein n=1 Tax=Actinoplanes couchii TaxID=403638 RepID=A0ABQ3XIU0_9ACTN|nr:hypothetical protein Aco03nite_068250 [Actinoplanes couchii]
MVACLALLPPLRDAPGIVAALVVLGLAGAILVGASGFGEVTLRCAGAPVFVAGSGIRLWEYARYPMPGAWTPEVPWACLAAAVAGLLTVAFGGGFQLAGPAGAFGLLAATTLVATGTTLFGIGSWEYDVLRTLAAAGASSALAPCLPLAPRLPLGTSFLPVAPPPPRGRPPSRRSRFPSVPRVSLGSGRSA